MENKYRKYAKAAEAVLASIEASKDEFTWANDTQQTTTELPTNLVEIIENTLAQTDVADGFAISGYTTNKLQVRLYLNDLNFTDMKYKYEFVRDNKLQVMLWSAFKTGVVANIQEIDGMIDTYTETTYLRAIPGGMRQVKAFFKAIAEVDFNAPVLIEQALQTWRRHMESLRIGYVEPNGNNPRSLSALIREAHFELDDAMTAIIEDQIQANQTRLENTIVSRTWGWEVEAPNPGHDVRVNPGVDKGHDGSLQSYERNDEDCQCSCYSCTYHDCDCDNCDDRNTEPEHCEDSDCNSNVSYEFRTTGGITRALHPGLKHLLDQIAGTEKNDTAGTHIHVYAKDLDAFQVGVVMAGYALTQNVWDVLCGRDTFNDGRCRQYANDIPAAQVASTIKDKRLYNVGKFNVVNTMHLATGRGTIEFRQMNCNFDYNRISFMGWMVRGLVESAKRGAKIAEFVGITDINGLVMLYAKYGFTYASETAEVEDPYGSRYRTIDSPLQFA